MNRLAAGVMRSPVLWGGLASLAFYALLQTGAIRGEFLRRYFDSHPVEHITTTMFFVGLAALVLKWFDVAAQFNLLGQNPLGAVPSRPEHPRAAAGHLATLESLPPSSQDGYLIRRLREALSHVCQKRSADKLDEELKYLSESDVARSQASYGLVMIVIWAIPILGFLGTVIGITLAIANLSPEALESSLPQVTAGLGTAFDTTALALALSMVLMFAKFLIQREEQRLLARVDQRVNDDLAARFQQQGTAGDPQLMAVERMAESVVEAAENTVRRQAELWQASIEAANSRWTELTADAGSQLERSLSTALAKGLQEHAAQLSASTAAQSEQNRQHWQQFEAALNNVASTIRAQQAELTRQGQVLLQVIDATGQVTRLEESLNRNLAAVSGSRNFEETLLSLAATINLLNARLGHAQGSNVVELGSDKTSKVGHAA
jgi:biopolymer transport protein ExbB/TolQ